MDNKNFHISFIIIGSFFLFNWIFSYNEKIISHWPNGDKKLVYYYNRQDSLIREINFKNNKKNGPYIEYKYVQDYNDHSKITKTISVTGFYNNNLKDSLWIHYDRRGEIKSKGSYDNNNKTGYWNENNSRGNYIIMQNNNRFCSEKIDLWKTYNSKGTVTSEKMYDEHGDAIFEKYFYHSGINPLSSLIYWEYTEAPGGSRYHQVKKSKTQYTYYENGQIRDEKHWVYEYPNYSTPYKDGIWKSFCKNGNIILEYSYNSGLPNGYYFSYGKYNTIDRHHCDGLDTNLFKEEGYYEQGFISGDIISYINDNKIILEKYNLLSEDKEKKTWNKWARKRIAKYTNYYKNGKVKAEGNVILSINHNSNLTYRNIIKDGKWKFYFENGNQMYEGIYENNIINNGEYIYYNIDGTIKGKLIYKDTYPWEGDYFKHFGNFTYSFNKLPHLLQISGKYKNGQKNGEWIKYYSGFDNYNNNEFDTLSVVSKGNYIEGKRNGHWICSFLIHNSKLRWYKGLTPYKLMTNSRQLRSIYKWTMEKIPQNSIDGHRYWYGDGDDESRRTVVLTEGKFKNGNQEGEWIAYRLSNNKILERANYKNNQLNGKIISYFDNGLKRFEGWYLNDQRDSLWTYYYDDGSIKAKGKIKNNQPDGEWDMYNRDGTKQKKEEIHRFF